MLKSGDFVVFGKAAVVKASVNEPVKEEIVVDTPKPKSQKPKF